MIRSILDNDFYKFTMQNAVVKLFPWAETVYEFTDRHQLDFPDDFVKQLQQQVENFRYLQLTTEEAEYLREQFPFLDPTYIDFLKGYRYNPEEVQISSKNKKLDVRIEGYWYRTILWEVPLMALISELYFKMTGQAPYPKAQRKAELAQKAAIFKQSSAKVADFGTRRRFSFENHDLVVRELTTKHPDIFSGTSNVHLAHKYGVKAIGTHAHEWFMHHSAKYGYQMANVMALENWAKIYHGDLGIALSDTFTTDVFFKAFGMKLAKLFDGVRHDSADPIEFADKVMQHYRSKDIDPRSKTIVFSDSLNPASVVDICNFCRGKIQVSFGIGTNLTNDVGVEPLNIVIKMTQQKPYGQVWTPVVKLSDVATKYSGDPDEIDLCKRVLKLKT